ncbi:MAG: hypothetical protein HY259_12740, partial [Chloroflexi bacterium]|nr:hypothetical protein [Chloroflexota bacterium]
YSALAYYADHQQALDKVIAEESAEVQRLWEANRNSPIRQKLRARGLM